MKKLFLLFVLATGFVACDKNDDMADINSLETKELTVAEINSEINGFVDSLGDSTTSKSADLEVIGNTCDLTSTELEIMLRAFNSTSVDRGFVSYDYRYWMTTSNTLYGIISISYSNGTGGRYIFGPAGGRGGIKIIHNHLYPLTDDGYFDAVDKLVEILQDDCADDSAAVTGVSILISEDPADAGWAVTTDLVGGTVTVTTEFEANNVIASADSTEATTTETYDIHGTQTTDAIYTVEVYTCTGDCDGEETDGQTRSTLLHTAALSETIVVSTGNTRTVDNPDYVEPVSDAFFILIDGTIAQTEVDTYAEASGINFGITGVSTLRTDILLEFKNAEGVYPGGTVWNRIYNNPSSYAITHTYGFPNGATGVRISGTLTDADGNTYSISAEF